MQIVKKSLSLIIMLVLSITSFTFYGSSDVQAASNSKRVFLYVGETNNGTIYPKFNTTDIDKFTNVNEFVILPSPHWEVYTDGSNNSYSRALSYIKDTVNTINKSQKPKPVIIGLPGLNSENAPFDKLYPKLQSFINQIDKELGNSVSGFYFNCEYMYNNPGKQFDYNNLMNNRTVKLANDLSYYVKNSLSKRYDFIWAPIYSNAENIAADTIKRVGFVTNRTNIFDEVLLQPNYYFNGTGTGISNQAPASNLQGVKYSIQKQQVTFRDGNPAAIKLSNNTTRIGVQMEIDGKISWGDPSNNLSASTFQNRYQQYVNAYQTFVGVYPISYYGAEKIHIFNTNVINSINQFYNKN